MDRNRMVQQLFDAFCRAFPLRTRQANQEAAHKYWKEIKNESNCEDLFLSKISMLKTEAAKPRGSLLGFLKPVSKKNTSAAEGEGVKSVPPVQPDEATPASQPSTSFQARLNLDNSTTSQFMCPKQEAISKELEITNAEISSLHIRERNGMLSANQKKALEDLIKQKKSLEKDLEKKKADQDRQRKSRLQRKKVLEEEFASNPQLAKRLKLRPDKGRPPIETDQPEILKTLIDLAQHGASADDRRRSENLRTVRTLDELTDGLQMAGFNISRTSVYYRLLPRNRNTIEGKRHIRTVPVRLAKAGKNLHKFHVDTRFCTASMNALDELASFLGPTEVAKLSQDDKARVPLGITAATLQAPLLMHMDYAVRLPDHDWAVADRHKLIPSVYAGIVIKDQEFGDKAAVTYSGPTYVAVRSGKHDKSTAYSHARDFEYIYSLPDFEDCLKMANGKPKPVLIVSTDGGPDENPRFQKTIEIAVHHFQRLELDALFICTNAPGRSAYNPVERRMAPLSKELAGVVLPHNHYGTHLDGQGKTIDTELERQNFRFAGETLAEIFSAVVIDEHKVISEFINSDISEIDKTQLLGKSAVWMAEHVRSSQYMLQIVKCTNENCCPAFRSTYMRYIEHRFLPAPVPLCYTPSITMAPQDQSSSIRFATLFQNLACFEQESRPYDYFCPSVASKLTERTCEDCGIYFASGVLLKKHAVVHKKPRQGKLRPKKIISKRSKELLVSLDDEDEWEVQWLDEDEINTIDKEIPTYEEVVDSILPIISIETHFDNPWTDEV